MSPRLRRLALPGALLELAGTPEAEEVVRQRPRGTGRCLVTSGVGLPGYRDYIRDKPRLIPFLW